MRPVLLVENNDSSYHGDHQLKAIIEKFDPKKDEGKKDEGKKSKKEKKEKKAETK